MMEAGMEWFNPPKQWNLENGVLRFVTEPETDFWRVTHYGFIRDNGHVYGQTVSGDCTLEAVFSAKYERLYDQAGLMLRLSETHWIKTGIEFTDGLEHLSVVVTNGQSDWSVLPLTTRPEKMRLRLTRRGEAVMIQYALEPGNWQLLRLAHFPAGAALAGAMACTPERKTDGLEVVFHELRVGPAVDAALHG
jgi:uncharacterized protein